MACSSRPVGPFVSVDSKLEDIKNDLRTTSYPLYSLKTDITTVTDFLGISNTSSEQDEVRTQSKFSSFLRF